MAESLGSWIDTLVGRMKADITSWSVVLIESKLFFVAL